MLKSRANEQSIDLTFKKKEENRKKYLKQQKKKLEVYHEKKRIGDLITKQKVEELQSQVLKHNPKRIYLNA